MKKQHSSFVNGLIWIGQTLLIFLVFYGIFFLLNTYVVDNCRVSGVSMQPTFENNERVMANRHSPLKRGEVIVLNAPDEPGSVYIKRIIGLPGDTITEKDNQTYINGKKINQDFLKPGSKLTDDGSDGTYGSKFTDTFDFSMSSLAKTSYYKKIYSKSQLQTMEQTNKVPQGTYFVMGDHRSVSKDSRYIGPIAKNKIIGVVKLRYWPFTRISTF